MESRSTNPLRPVHCMDSLGPSNMDLPTTYRSSPASRLPGCVPSADRGSGPAAEPGPYGFRLQNDRAAGSRRPIEGPDREQLDSTIRTLIRWRDSIAPELVILALVVVNTVMIFRERIVSASPWVVYASSALATAHLTPAGWYYTVVSQVIYQFLVGLCLWKWLLCTYFLFKLSRMNLELEASHPDKHGGIGFLGMSPLAFAPVAFAITAAIGATWRDQILRSGAHLTDFKFPALALFILIMIVAIGPLTFFSPKLTTLRRQGVLEYGSLAHFHSGEFHDKWIRHRSGHEQEFLSAPEISSLIDLASSFQNIEGMRTFPMEKNCLIVLVLSILLPAPPTILAEVPLAVVLKDLLEAAR
jgi:hypothetical protein